MTCYMIGTETLKKYCEKNGIAYQTMYTRIMNGYTPEEAIKSHVNRRCNLKYLINGKSARSQMGINEYQRYVKRVKGTV
ncbi:MAG: hypothetical protein J6S67_11035 [Methanobrevibacter sp.]|nr:hypothetical protein [Methanobrevibacter sp.]